MIQRVIRAKRGGHFLGEESSRKRVSFNGSKTGRLWYAHIGRKAKRDRKGNSG
jgi:hypothetical protein